MPYLDPDSIISREQFGAALTTARESVGLTVRELADRCDLPVSTVGGYLSGSHLPTLRMLGQFESVLRACGIEDPQTLAEWRTACLRLRRTQTSRRPDAVVPYLGLRSYDTSDADIFFGRESLIDALYPLVVTPSPKKHILGVIGPSGSGKSSLVKAGLIPRLQDPGSSDSAWSVVTMTPGRSPMANLHACLTANAKSAPASAPVALVIDQFEEAFAPSVGEEELRDFLNALDVVAVRAIILILRADFYGRALGYQVLARSFQANQLVVGPMTAPELRRAIIEPARTVGVELPEPLVEVLLSDLAPRGGAARVADATGLDAGHEAGALPLLSHALRETWARARRGVVTVEDYLATGGIRAAVASTADQVYAALTPHEQDIAARVFLRMVSVSEDAADTRRRVSFQELDFGDDTSVDDVVERFVTARLLTVGDDSVEIAHEVLISAWPRLRGWLDADRTGMVLHRRLADAANTWRDSGADPALLARGGRLQVLTEWADDPRHKGYVNVAERSFLDASIAAVEAERLAERRRTRRLQSALAGLLALTLVAAGLTTYAFQLRLQADRDRDVALSRQLAETSQRVQLTDPSAAAQLAVLAYRTSETAEARSALLDVSARPLATRATGPGGPIAVATSADGSLIAAVGDRGGLTVWRSSTSGGAVTLSTLASVSGVDKQPLYTAAFSPDNRLLVTAGQSGTVHVWRVEQDSLTESPALTGPAARVGGLAFSPDGTMLAAASDSVHLWRVADGTFTPATRLKGGTAIFSALAFTADSRTIAAGGVDKQIFRWSVAGSATPKPLLPVLTGPEREVTSLAFNPQGTRLVAGSQDHKAYLWTLPATTPRTSLVLEDARSWVNAVAFADNGTQLLVGGSDHHLRVYDVESATVISDLTHPGPITGAALARSGTTLVTGATDGILRVWPTPVVGASTPGASVWNLAYGGRDRLHAASGSSVLSFALAAGAQPKRLGTPIAAPASSTDSFDGTLDVSPSGKLAAIGGLSGGFWLADVSGTSAKVVGTAHKQTALVESTAFSHDGKIVAASSDDASVVLYDVSDPAHPVPLGEPIVAVKGGAYFSAFSRDDSMLAIGTSNPSTVTLWDIRDRAKPVRIGLPTIGPELVIYSLAFSPDGGLLAVGSADRTVRLLDVRNPKEPVWIGNPLLGAGDYVFSVAFSADGRTLASASGDGVLRLWDVTAPTAPRLVAELRAAGDTRLYTLKYSPDGTQLAAGGSGTTIHIWELDPTSIADRVCRVTGVHLSDAEWQQYVPNVPRQEPCPTTP